MCEYSLSFSVHLWILGNLRVIPMLLTEAPSKQDLLLYYRCHDKLEVRLSSWLAKMAVRYTSQFCFFCLPRGSSCPYLTEYCNMPYKSPINSRCRKIQLPKATVTAFIVYYARSIAKWSRKIMSRVSDLLSFTSLRSSLNWRTTISLLEIQVVWWMIISS